MHFTSDKGIEQVRFADIEADVREDLRLRQSLKHIKVGAAAACLALLIFFGALLICIWQLLHQSYDEELGDYAAASAAAVRRMGDSDLNTLRSLGVLVRDGVELSEDSRIEIKDYASFITLSYWGLNGEHSCLSPSGGWEHASMEELAADHRAVITQALQGQSAVSEPFYAPGLNEAVIVYAVPVYDGDRRIMGVLSAVRRLSDISAVLQEQQSPSRSAHLYLVSCRGICLAAPAEPSAVLQPFLTAPEPGSISVELQHRLSQALMQQRPLQFTDLLSDTDYAFALRPVYFGGWSIAAAGAFDSKASPYYTELTTLAALLILVFAAALLVNLAVGTLLTGSFRRQVRLSFYDPITQGHNLRKFILVLSAHYLHRSDAVLCALNVRDLRYINEYAGTQCGDELIALIYQEAVRCPETALIGREQGDQFYLVLKVDPDDAEAQARLILQELFTRISRIFASKFTFFALHFYAGIIPLDFSDSAAVLLQRVKLVQSAAAAVKTPEHAVKFYAPQMYQDLIARRQAEAQLLPALQHGEFKLYLQPKFIFSTGRVQEAEALARWQLPDGSVRAPAEFIPLLVDSGLCARLDLYMLEEACKALRAWIDAGCEPVQISVNQCRQLLFSPDYLTQVEALLKRYQLPAQLICIEILEEIAAQDLPQLDAYLLKLHALGVGIAIDDFGSGYSSLNMLSAVKVDEIKFDKGFLLERDPARRKLNLQMLTQFAGVAQIFKARTVVEGVETAADAAFLQEHGFDAAQGYYYSRPLPFADFSARFVPGFAAPAESAV